jgi:hypothetical protein
VTVDTSPLSSGYRLVLRYDLTHKKACQTDSAAAFEKDVDDLRDILSCWDTHGDDATVNGVLGYVLERQYKGEGLNRDCLLGRDRCVVEGLEAASRDSGFHICLANLTRNVYGLGGRRDMLDVIEKSLILDRIVDLDGCQRFDSPSDSFDEDDVLQQNYFNALGPDEEDYIEDEELFDRTHHRSVYYPHSSCRDDTNSL